MRYKQIAVMAVIAIFLASSFCIPMADADDGGKVVNDDEIHPIRINDKTATGTTFDGYPGVVYTTDGAYRHTLTFNEDIKVDDVTCDKDDPFIIDVNNVDSMTIVVNANVTLGSNSVLPGDVEIGDAGGIRVSNGSLQTNTGVLNITGSGQLTIKPPMMDSDGKTSNAIFCTHVNIIGTKVVIDGSAGYDHGGSFRGIRARCYAHIVDSYVKITGTNKDMGGITTEKIYLANQGIFSTTAISIESSEIEMEKVISGLYVVKNEAGAQAVGSCAIKSSKVKISTITSDFEGAVSIPIYVSLLSISDSYVNATAGDVHETMTTHVSYSVGAFTHIFHADSSTVILAGGKGYTSGGLDFAVRASVMNSNLTCTTAHGAGAEGNVQAGIKTAGSGTLVAYGSTITSMDLESGEDYSYGIAANCIFTKSTIVAEGKIAFYDDNGKFSVTFDDETTASLMGVKIGKKSYESITSSDVFGCSKVRSAEGLFATFELNGGTGSEVAPISNVVVGTWITLPECDAKDGNKVFSGWNDGKNIYQPGDKYYLTDDTVFFAQYHVVPEPEPEKKDNDNTGLIIICAIVAILVVLAIVAYAWKNKG